MLFKQSDSPAYRHSGFMLLFIALYAAAFGGRVQANELTDEFPFKRRYVNVAEYFTESHLAFDAENNVDGIFVSGDSETDSFSDARARRELIELNADGGHSLISYIDEGDPDGDPIVLFHGVPTSMFEWRNVIPELAKHGRVIAFDQIGHGYSSKHKNLTYTFKQHLAYVEAFFKELGLDRKKITIVATDTGGSLGFAYAMRHPEKIKGLAFFETIFGPIPSLSAMTLQAQDFRTAEGNRKIIDDNIFLNNLIVHSSEIVSPNQTPFSIREFSQYEINAYLRPFRKKERRRVLAQWINEVPVVGGAPDQKGDANIDIWMDFANYLINSDVPKLYLFASPGVLNPAPITDFVLENFNKNDSLAWVDLGLGYHFLQEDYPDRVAKEIAGWFVKLPE